MPVAQCQLCGLTDPDSFQYDHQLHNQSLQFDPDEVARGNASIGTNRSKLADIDKAIAKLEKARSEVKKVIQAQQMYLAPIDKLSDDILRMVFAILAGLSAKDSRMSRTSGELPTPWLTAAVSTRWRALSLGMPDLWATVHYFWYHDDDDTREREERRVRLQLQRAGSTPLRVFFRLLNVQGRSTELEPDPGLLEFIQCFPRCRVLKLFDDLPDTTIPRSVPYRLDYLEELHISSGHNWLGAILAVTNAPKLRLLKLTAVRFASRSNAIPNAIPDFIRRSESLATLEIVDSWIPEQTLLHILRSATNLSTLILTRNRMVVEGPTSLNDLVEVDLWNLRKLTVDLGEDQSLLAKLRAPYLSTLAFPISSFRRIGPSPRTVIEFIQRSTEGHSPITTLSIIKDVGSGSFTMKPDQYVVDAVLEVLCLLPSLRALHIHDPAPYLRHESWAYVTAILSGLTLLNPAADPDTATPVDSAVVPCKNLAEFYWSDCGGIRMADFPWEALRDMIKSRHSVGSLKRASVMILPPGQRSASDTSGNLMEQEGFRWLVEAQDAGHIAFRYDQLPDL